MSQTKSTLILERIKQDQQKMLKELEKNPNIELACQKTGIPRASLYRWMSLDNFFRNEVSLAREVGRGTINDYVESKLLKKIREDDTKSIFFFLRHRHPDYRNAHESMETLKAQIEWSEQHLKDFSRWEREATPKDSETENFAAETIKQQSTDRMLTEEWKRFGDENLVDDSELDQPVEDKDETPSINQNDDKEDLGESKENINNSLETEKTSQDDLSI